ncbi:hypothetical protein CDV50_15280 [Haematobacter massiliensis]|nr:hypothetical protein CDV50_15280 [Haematobacter massiliensis]OWJ83357.1 hypothetical protein CDV51_16165 [Haematobacter massiliensis]
MGSGREIQSHSQFGFPWIGLHLEPRGKTMKKILFATTALVMTAGVAAAEVAVTGDGRMGIVYDGENANFNSRIRAIFTMAGETDGGLTFGGSIRADNSTGGAVGANGNIFISGEFGKIAMGDVDGALENAVGDLSGIGYSNANSIMEWYETEYLNTTNNQDPYLLYSYSFGDFGFYAGMSDGTAGGMHGNTDKDTPRFEQYSVGATYDFGDFGIAGGYESRKAENYEREYQWIVSADAAFGDAALKGFYGKGKAYNYAGNDIDIDTGFLVAPSEFQKFDQYGVSFDYTMGPTTVTAFYRELSLDTTGDAKYYGLGAAYNLGGGATLKGGVMKMDRPDGAYIQDNQSGSIIAQDETVADFGVVFKF